ncbi:fungal-specific transcription factor domain-containing protein [Dactylonectria macrodidyma]|uniref:Fungal-specific transcription factor domain-containing protein n=1 Tax=Dactylonectria macrodidyma TaxID=307937 RepID=A0A9P9DKE6_9HYPO|nr:fungal-specific transcription factor domain-containing protein [Dactylonectria macrodidyma]
MLRSVHEQDLPSHSTTTRRPYRSKRNKPCSLCRARKTSCRRTDNEISCVSCRKRGQRCSFLDERSPSAGTSPVEATRPGHVGSSVDAFITNSADVFMALPTEDAIDADAASLFEHQMGHNGFMNPNDMAVSALFEGLPDPTIWCDPVSASQPTPHLPHNALDTINFDVDSITVPAMQPLCETALDIDEPMSSGPGRSQTGGSVSESSSPMHVTETHHPLGVSPGQANHEYSSIDQRLDFQSTYFGLSGESDPYLLRHYLYNDADEFPFLRVIYRRAQTDGHGSEQVHHSHSTHATRNQKSPVPIQFLLTSNELGEEHKKIGPTSQLDKHQSSKAELDALVNDEHGRRLVLLFVEYVFPALPVISRSQLARSITHRQSSTTDSSDSIPPYLLAAIYASSLQFSAYDEVLCVSNIYKKPSSERLWQIVYEGIQSDLHTPHMATISAALLFLNKPRLGVQHVSADTSFTWSFTTSIVGIVTSLGLHLECKSWSIPDWEKRLRRRLWWMVFSEEKWRSLLLGRPSVIAKDQWNVSGLTTSDFDMDDISIRDDYSVEVHKFLKALQASAPASGSDQHIISQQIATLACIADNIYSALYTIRATQALADNLDASVKTIRPLREELTLWYAKLPASLKSHKKSDPERTAPITPSSAACLRFAYLTLEVLLYRALLRPLGGADFGEDGQDLQSKDQVTHESGARFVTPDHADHVAGNIKKKDPSFRVQAEPIISAAENCAALVTKFTVELMSWDFAGFWYSWSRIGWATTSSFLALLLVQSPSVEHAITCKVLIDRWRQILRHQSQSFHDMSLGILRLDAMYWSDMKKIFRVNKYLAEAIARPKQ